ncbi:DNA-binding MarR family transcriptional regulator [Humibacillus xanthopallidus]|uniref:DNA-binding MarR family transcriptional regulator n=1 Tax=Humibacillus xanthopallidus TaxID=412689 RepID=A0A543PV19_9MICO|nr:MarR family transcriptional regulator [Humibacillus xanthopallidus]TQN47910.1 DNA-binding MarR family transcriptional regulator [Humibacillus xanthopallidus]
MNASSGDEVDAVVSAWRRERPDVDVSSIGIVVPVLRLATLVAERRAGVLGTYGLDQSHLDVLGVLRRSGPPYRLTAGELSRRCRVTPGATTQRVQSMERAGLVERVREEPDRRTVHVQLTASGLRRLDEVFADVVAADESLLAGLTPAQRSGLEDVLRGWLDVVQAGPLAERPESL